MNENTPNTINGEVTTRRKFLKWFSGILATIGGIVLAIPFLGSLGGPSFRVGKHHFAKVTKVGDLPTGDPDNVDYPDIKTEAYIHEHTTRNVWAIKNSDTDVTVFSPICPHLGCRYKWHPDKNEFICPCHGSVFSKTGKVLGGPAPRPLDTLPHKITDGELYVEWERFEVGIPEKKII